MYAIIETGGKQYRVTTGDVVSFEKLAGNIGDTVTFDKVLLMGGGTDAKVLVGRPYIEKATLEAEIVEQAKGDKIVTIKYKRRKGYRRTIGHRQMLTRVLVTKIANGSTVAEFDVTKRKEVLTKASVPVKALAAKAAASTAAAKTATKKAAAAPKKTVAKKTTTKKKSDA